MLYSNSEQWISSETWYLLGLNCVVKADVRLAAPTVSNGASLQELFLSNAKCVTYVVFAYVSKTVTARLFTS